LEICLPCLDCADNAIFFNIYLGSHNVRLDAVDEPTRVEVRSTEYTVHPEWGPVRIVNDVALIKLPAPIEFTRKNSINSQRHPFDWNLTFLISVLSQPKSSPSAWLPLPSPTTLATCSTSADGANLPIVKSTSYYLE
jgi:hypothetical protein